MAGEKNRLGKSERERYRPSATSPASNVLPQTAHVGLVCLKCAPPRPPPPPAPPAPHYSFMSEYQRAAVSVSRKWIF